MRVTKMLEKALRLYNEIMSMDDYFRWRSGMEPKPPYYETKHPREENPHHEYWLRIRSNPFRSNYH